MMIIAPDEWSGANIQAAYACPNCYKLNIATEHVDGHVDEPAFRDLKEAEARTWGWAVRWLPKSGESRDFPDVPPYVGQAATEATLCLSMGAYRAVGALARAVVEATAKDKGCEGGNLAARIDALAEAGHVREHTKEQAHEVRYFGNDMAHGDFTDPVTEEEAAEVVQLMAEVLDEVYQSPARLDRARQARLAKKAQEQ